MSARHEAKLWMMQRVTAAILAVCIVVHLVTIVYAVRGGLHASDILGRTRGSWPWGAFYSVFVIAAALHGAIGLRAIAAEWLRWRGPGAEFAVTIVGLVLVVTGLRAVVAVVGS